MRKIVYRIDENDKDLTILSFLKRKQYSHQVITNLKKTTCGMGAKVANMQPTRA